ncbi:MAG: hypothetical protein M0021_09195 [Clostridia bacterium]|nr:hypothetical protein [Clostridia bacterium]
MKKRLLIVGAGVIGSIYAVKFSEAGYNVSIFARSKRLIELKENGLLYKKGNKILKANVHIISGLLKEDKYDFVFVAVRFEQIIPALYDLAENESDSFVTMVNTAKGYEEWSGIIGTEKLIVAFPGAGGGIENGVLHYKLTPFFVQPTTFGVLTGNKTWRIEELANIFKVSKFPNTICNNMDAWQKSHLAMVIPMANAIYLDGGNAYTTSKNNEAMIKMCSWLKENFRALKKMKIPITPFKLNLFLICPTWLLKCSLKLLFRTKFAATVISEHANKAKQEMLLLDSEFRKVINIT